MKPIRVLAFALVVLLIASLCLGQTKDFKLIIGQRYHQFQGVLADIPVYFMGDIKSVDSLKLLIAYHAGALKFNNLVAGNKVV